MGRIRGKITDDYVKGFKPPQSGQHIEWDNKIPGFGVRINAGGSKSFVLNYTLNGKRRRYKIGRFPAMSATAARITANQLVTGINAGVGPPDLKIQSESAPTFATKYLEYAQTHKRAGTRAIIRRVLQSSNIKNHPEVS
jgi:hypothetical protein